MTAKIPFVKMHGLGNDFVMINFSFIPEGIIKVGFVEQILNRRLGIGGDQLILFTFKNLVAEKNNIVEMVIYNADGSRAKACGNASICMTRLMKEHGELNDFILSIGGRHLKCKTIETGEYQVNMGRANYNANWMPTNQQLCELARKYNIEPKELICIDVGNPHLVIFSNLSEQDMKRIGSELQQIDIFSDGINVNFANINGNTINLKVYERGTGFTLSCGSGACASFVASYKLGKISISSDDIVEVVFKLGSLKMRMDAEEIIMSGPAEYTFFGEYVCD